MEGEPKSAKPENELATPAGSPPSLEKAASPGAALPRPEEGPAAVETPPQRGDERSKFDAAGRGEERRRDKSERSGKRRRREGPTPVTRPTAEPAASSRPKPLSEVPKTIGWRPQLKRDWEAAKVPFPDWVVGGVKSAGFLTFLLGAAGLGTALGTAGGTLLGFYEGMKKGVPKLAKDIWSAAKEELWKPLVPLFPKGK